MKYELDESLRDIIKRYIEERMEFSPMPKPISLLANNLEIHLQLNNAVVDVFNQNFKDKISEARYVMDIENVGTWVDDKKLI